jgi:hypothetical protein
MVELEIVDSVFVLGCVWIFLISALHIQLCEFDRLLRRPCTLSPSHGDHPISAASWLAMNSYRYHETNKKLE